MDLLGIILSIHWEQNKIRRNICRTFANDFPFDKFLDGYRDAYYYELVEDGVRQERSYEILKVLRKD